ncbi:MAG: DotU family type IV/VI secretion system protein [Spirochaetaceae bacterium]|jgi:type VI protein secretion system component VasF|nr:DotU family type IV/VI secretion system protein [Spirochaetaceae bacterium]
MGAAAAELERLCNPLLLAICQYWQLACINSPVELGPFREHILALLEETREKAGQDQALAREFERIEKPLIFFIDYMVREGRFSFRDQWHILARNYNELSGDEKFFDLLDETLQDPESASAASLFFVMLALGFDGMYRRNQNRIQGFLSRCAQKAGTDLAVLSKPIVPETKKRPGIFARRRLPGIRFALIASALVMAAGFFYNMAVFVNNTAEYRVLVEKTASDAIPGAAWTFAAPPVAAPPPEGAETLPAEGAGSPLDPLESVPAAGGEYDLVYPEADDSANSGGLE